MHESKSRFSSTYRKRTRYGSLWRNLPNKAFDWVSALFYNRRLPSIIQSHPPLSKGALADSGKYESS